MPRYIRIGRPAGVSPLGFGFGRRSSFGGRSAGGSRIGGRLIIAVVIAVFSLISYYGYRAVNPVTGETQYINLSVQDEVQLGLAAVPEMTAQFGGAHPDAQMQALLDQVGGRIVQRSDAGKGEYPFEFTVLADPQTINAFALPGGQVFITAGLLAKLETEGQLAGVLAHEIVHVIGRHSAEHIAKAQLTQGLTGAAVIAAADPDRPGSAQATAALAMLVGQMVNMKYGRDDELEADLLGVKYMAQAGYDPRAMITVMEVLRAASEGGAPPEFFSTHPDPDRRIEQIEAAIAQHFPRGVPAELTP